MIPSRPADDDQNEQSATTDSHDSDGNASVPSAPAPEPATKRRVLSCSAINRMNPWAAARLRRYYQL